MLSKSIESSGAHRRLALGMVGAVGHLGRRGLILGFMLATAICSMWMSNSATVLMMLPVALAVLDADGRDDLRAPLLLGVAYAGSIGGIATPIGTPPNAVFLAVHRDVTGVEYSFAEWMGWGVPVVVILLPCAWLILSRVVERGAVRDVPHPGPWRAAERRVLTVLLITAAAWILRKLPFAGGGWSAWFGIESAGDETVALAAVCAMFLTPSGEGAGRKLLDWDTAAKIPWGLLLLFGGGIAIATAFRESGLSDRLGAVLGTAAALPVGLVILTICLGVTFLTEVTSNTATAVLLMPILAAAAGDAGLPPALLMAPAAMSASCAFMLPVATAPNAIVFGTGRVSIRRMARAGLVLNLCGAVVITAIALLVVRATTA
jgi:sodium-dependent dicarboxylate transporter 2/3/5